MIATELPDELAKLYLALQLGSTMGMMPSVRELAEALNVSVGTVHSRMRKLEALGLVERMKGKQRAVRILKGKVA